MKSVSKTFTVYPVFNPNTDQECDVEVEVTVTAEFSYESDYGADADGNRGRATWWLDGWEIEGATYLGESTPVNSEIEKAVEDTIGDIHFDL